MNDKERYVGRGVFDATVADYEQKIRQLNRQLSELDKKLASKDKLISKLRKEAKEKPMVVSKAETLASEPPVTSDDEPVYDEIPVSHYISEDHDLNVHEQFLQVESSFQNSEGNTFRKRFLPKSKTNLVFLGEDMKSITMGVVGSISDSHIYVNDGEQSISFDKTKMLKNKDLDAVSSGSPVTITRYVDKPSELTIRSVQ